MRLATDVGLGAVERVDREVEVSTRNLARLAQAVFFGDDAEEREALIEELDVDALSGLVRARDHVVHLARVPVLGRCLEQGALCADDLDRPSDKFFHDDADRVCVQVSVGFRHRLSWVVLSMSRRCNIIAPNQNVNMKLIFATHNSGKLEEMRALLEGLDVEVMSAEEAGVLEDVEEDGETFRANAWKKAKFVAEQTGEWAVGEDTGLCIEALGGQPGVYTARWSGGAGHVPFTLEKMSGVPEGDREAYFETALVLMSPKGESHTFVGRCDGSIPLEPRGEAHPKLPYDVIFQPKGFDQIFAQMPKEQKNAISHRGQAFQKLKEFLRTNT